MTDLTVSGCKNCFQNEGPIPTLGRADRGTCSYCKANNGDGLVWNSSIFRESFLILFDNYQLCDEGPTIEAAIAQDWELFSYGEEIGRRFLEDAIGTHEFFENDARVSHVSASEVDFLGLWDRYVAHLVGVNRYFPPRDSRNVSTNTISTWDLAPLGEMIIQNLRKQREGVRLYRGRVSGRNTQPFPADQMWAPPADLAKPGRCNPSGIPHLYVASDIATCIAESRSTPGEHVSIAAFTPIEDLRMLDLDILDVMNPFTASAASDDMLTYLHVRRILMRLQKQMSTPIRSSDVQSEYIPTQFLCEYAKYLGLDGVIYSSTLTKEGTNMVIFDQSKVKVSELVDLYEVVGSEIDFKPLIREKVAD